MINWCMENVNMAEKKLYGLFSIKHFWSVTEHLA